MILLYCGLFHTYVNQDSGYPLITPLASAAEVSSGRRHVIEVICWPVTSMYATAGGAMWPSTRSWMTLLEGILDAQSIPRLERNVLEVV
jgi:hypothetical protein